MPLPERLNNVPNPETVKSVTKATYFSGAWAECYIRNEAKFSDEEICSLVTWIKPGYDNAKSKISVRSVYSVVWIY
jgi:hypothetical protein